MPGLIDRIQGDIPGAAWPPLFSTRSAPLVALILQLERSQRFSAADIAARQRRQIVALARHHGEHSPHFQARLERAKLAPDDLGTADGFARLRPLTRREVQDAGEAMFAPSLPPGHGGIHHVQSSGSTGEPVKVRKTDVNQLFWLAMTLRYHDWHEPDFSGRFCASRALIGEVRESPSWGSLFDQFGPTGPSLQIDNGTDIGEQLALIRAFAPTTLLVYPSNLGAMLARLEQRGETIPGLQRLLTIGETLPPSLRVQAEEQLGVAVRDCYSSEEVGYVAVECPESGLYHVMSETVLVEVMGEGGKACREGEIGRVLVTDLHNMAMPLIRYAIGDYAEAGPACPCGRGLPTLRRILGRERNLVVTPDGRSHWPITGYKRFAAIAPIVQYQLLQHSLDDVEVRLVSRQPVTDEQEDALRSHIQESLGHRFAIRFRYYQDRIPASASGKFEEFVRLF